MKTPLTFQIILMAAVALALSLSTPPHAAQRPVARAVVDPPASSYDNTVRDDFILTCGTIHGDTLAAQPKEFPREEPAVTALTLQLSYLFGATPASDNTGRDTFTISNTGTIYMSDQGLTPEQIEAARKNKPVDPRPLAPDWVPTE